MRDENVEDLLVSEYEGEDITDSEDEEYEPEEDDAWYQIASEEFLDEWGAQLEQIDKFIDNKKDIFSEYESFFKKKGIKIFNPPKNTKWNYWLISIILENKNDRNLFLSESHKSKMLVRPIWALMSKLPMYKNCQKDELTNSLFYEDRVVNLISSTRL